MCCLSFFSFSFKRQSSGLTGHHTPPPALAVVFLFFPRRFVLFRLFWPCVLFVLVFLRGAILGPRAVFGFSRDCSEALSLGREAVEAFVRFLVRCFSRFAASRVSRGRCTYLQVGGPAGGLARSPCLSEGKGSNALLGRRGSDPLLFGFFLLLVFALGHRDPRAYLFAGAIVVSPLGSHTHGFFFPPGPFSLSFSFALAALWLHPAIPRGWDLCGIFVGIRGKCWPFFSFLFFVVWFLSFAVFLAKFSSSKGRFCEKFSGANFCFCFLFGSVCFWYGFAYGFFCVFFRNFAPKVLLKISLLLRAVFFLFEKFSGANFCFCFFLGPYVF